MSLKFITFNHLRILANNLKNYLNKYNETIKNQKINNITASTAITTLEGYNITIPTVEIQDYSDVENRKYPQLNNVFVREYPDFKTIENPTFPNIKTIDKTTIPDINTKRNEEDFRTFRYDEISSDTEGLDYIASKKNIIIANSWNSRTKGWVTGYCIYRFINGKLYKSNKIEIEGYYNSPEQLSNYLLKPQEGLEDYKEYDELMCILHHDSEGISWYHE